MTYASLNQRTILIESVLEQLEEWRHLPAYQLERRVDVIFGLVLPQIVKCEFNLRRDDELTVIPEFPLHNGKVLGKKVNRKGRKIENLSSNVDFVVFSRDDRRIFLIELKTDNYIMRQNVGTLSRQLGNLKQTQNVGSRKLLEGVLRLAIASDESHKYSHLIYKLQKLGCLIPKLNTTDLDMKN